MSSENSTLFSFGKCIFQKIEWVYAVNVALEGEGPPQPIKEQFVLQV